MAYLWAGAGSSPPGDLIMDSGSSGAEWVAGEPVGSGARVASSERRSWGRWAVLVLGGLSYAFFVTSLARFIGFVSGLGVRDVDSGPWVRVLACGDRRRT